MPNRTRRALLNLVPRVDAHPTHAVVDGVTYPGGLAEYEAHRQADERLEREAESRYEQTLGGWA